MRQSHLLYLCCPKCKSDLILDIKESDIQGVKEGSLKCSGCTSEYPIIRHIPRFLSGPQNYSDSFGYQWNRHYRTQYDSYSGISVSEDRFFNETRWSHDLKGQIILEAGSGSGRFTEHAAATGAFVVSFDYSSAVEANYKNNGHFENVLIVQASIYEMPFRKGYFDKVLCIGVIQHTPDPEKAFYSLVEMICPKGDIVIDAYRRYPWWKHIFLTKYWIRPITKRMSSETLYKFCEIWVNIWWGVTGIAVKITKRRALSWFLCVADYRGVYPFKDSIQKEWSILDTFDMLSPTYDFPKTLNEVEQWFIKSSLNNIEVNFVDNVIEARGSNK